MHTIIKELEKLLSGLAKNQAIPDDSWKKTWRSLKSGLGRLLPSSEGNSMPEEDDGDLYVVALYDSFDMVWIDTTGPLTRSEAARIWNTNTENGTRYKEYKDGDYYMLRRVGKDDA